MSVNTGITSNDRTGWGTELDRPIFLHVTDVLNGFRDLRAQDVARQHEADPGRLPPSPLKLMGLSDDEIHEVIKAHRESSETSFARIVVAKGFRTLDQVDHAFALYCMYIRRANRIDSFSPFAHSEDEAEAPRYERGSQVYLEFLHNPCRENPPFDCLYGLSCMRLGAVKFVQALGYNRSFGEIAEAMGFISARERARVSRWIETIKRSLS